MLKQWLYTLLIIAAIATIAASLFWPGDPSEHWRTVFFSVGQAALVSGMFGAFAKSELFLGIYRQTLAEVVSEPAQLTQRKDLQQVWTNVTQVMVGDEFPGLVESISSHIVQQYLPINTPYYYSDFDQHIDVISYDVDTRLLRLKETTIVEVVPRRSDGNIQWVWEWCPCVSATSGTSRSSIELVELFVNDEPIDLMSFRDEELWGGRKGKRFTETLVDAKRIKRVSHRTVDMNADPTLVQTVAPFTTKARVTLTNPLADTIGSAFDSVGTIKEFRRVRGERLAGSQVEVLVMESQALMFPRQGYILAFVQRIPILSQPPETPTSGAAPGGSSPEE